MLRIGLRWEDAEDTERSHHGHCGGVCGSQIPPGSLPHEAVAGEDDTTVTHAEDDPRFVMSVPLRLRVCVSAVVHVCSTFIVYELKQRV